MRTYAFYQDLFLEFVISSIYYFLITEMSYYIGR